MKSNLIKFFTLLFVACSAFAVATMPKVSAQEVSNYSVIQSATIRNEEDGVVGLQFSSSVNKSWLNENKAEKYSFGTLLYPTANEGAFDNGKTATENMNLLDAVNIIHLQNQAVSGAKNFNASIVYDRQVVIDTLTAKGLTVTDDLVDDVLNKLYAKEFSAKAYAVVDGETIYANSYSTSMYKVASKIYADGSEVEKALALNYFKSASIQNFSVNFADDILSGEYTVSQNAMILRGGESLVNGADYTVNENGKIVFPADYRKLDTQETLYIIDNGVLTVANVTYGADAKTVTELLAYDKAGETVVVKGYYVGVAVDNLFNYSSIYHQLLIKDTQTDDIIAFNTPNNLGESYGITKGAKYCYEDIKNIKYERGDYVVLKGTFRTTSTNNTTRKDVVISAENPSDINKTIISRNNVVNYSFNDVQVLDEWSDWSTLFKSSVKPYTYVRIKGKMFFSIKYGGDYTEMKDYYVAQGLTTTQANNKVKPITAMYILHMNESATTDNAMKVPGGSVVAKSYVWDINLGQEWNEFLGVTVEKARPGVAVEVDMYALYTGRSSVYTAITPLEFGWLKVHDHVYDDGEEVATCTVEDCGHTHRHQYVGEWQTESLSTVISKGIEYRECVANGCTKKEYRDTEKATAVSIAVTTKPNVIQYNPGENVDVTGMVVTVTGDNGSTCEVTDYTVEDKVLTREDSTITIMYNGLTTTLTLEMVPEHEHVYSGDYILEFAPTFFEVGSEYRICTFEGCDERENREIGKVEMTSIKVVKMPIKTTYFVYETFDKTGLQVTGYGANGYSEDITEYATVTANQIVLGENTVTVSYGELTESFTVTGIVASVSSVKNDVQNGAKVLVEGYFVGVADEGYQADKEMLIKDLDTDDIIAVRGVSYDTFANNYGYNYGDKVKLIATLKVDGTTYTANKKYLQFSNENGDKSSTIISNGNAVNYSLENAVELDTYHDWKEVFTTSSESYVYVHITGVTYASKFKSSDNVNSLVLNSLLGFTGSASELKVNGRYVALRFNVMDNNVGGDWLNYFAKDYLEFNGTSSTSYVGPGYLKEVDIYAVFTGASENYYQLTILTEDWIKDVPVKATEELTSSDIIREIALSYYRQNEQIQYNQKVSMRNINAKPEDATSQHLIYLDCSSFVGAVIKEALGIEIIPDEVVGTYITDTNKYNLINTYPQTGRFATYANYYAGNPDYPDIIKFVTRSEMNTDAERQALAKELEEGLQPGDVINYRKKGDGSGHVMLYIGNGYFIHCQGDDYNEGKTNPSSAYDGAFGYETRDGAIGFLTLYDVLYNTSHTRYIPSSEKSENISWFRPLNRADAKITDSALVRMQYRGIDAEKTLDVGVNTSVQKGQIMTYTITVENHSLTDYTGVEFKEILSPNVTLVEAPNGYVLNGNEVTFKVDVPHYKFTTITYKVKVNDDAVGLIESANTTLGGVKLAKIVNSVASYTTAELNAVATKAKGFASSGASFENDMDIVSSLYGDLGITAFDKYTTIESMFDELMDTSSDVLNDVEIASFVAPNLYGGRDMASNYVRNKDIVRLIEEYNLSVGDIIVAEFDLYNNTSSTAVKTGNVVHVIYVYVGNSQLVCLTDDANHVAFTNGTASAGATVDKCFTITISNNIRKDTHTLASVFTYDRWVVLRPF